jgi:hypothetical protein
MFDVLYVFVLSTRERVSLSCKNLFFYFFARFFDMSYRCWRLQVSQVYTFYMFRASWHSTIIILLLFSVSIQTLDSSSTAHRGVGNSLPRPESCNLERFTTLLRLQSHNLLANSSTNSLHSTNDINTSITLLTDYIRSCAIKSKNTASQSLTQLKKNLLVE